MYLFVRAADQWIYDHDSGLCVFHFYVPCLAGRSVDKCVLRHKTHTQRGGEGNNVNTSNMTERRQNAVEETVSGGGIFPA